MTNAKRFYITTPIYYVNGLPHIGHAYTTTLADTLTRFYTSAGYESFFLTGTDEHGDKIQQAAAAQGKAPLEFATEISGIFKKNWDDFGLKYSRFIRTTEEGHKKFVSDILQKIYDKGDIYFGEYGGNYCYGCERFLTDKELVDGKCPDHLVAPTWVSESNYFFRMSKYQDALQRHLTEVQPDFIRPERYKNEILAMLRENVGDLCISRPKARLTWGIELPFDPNYVTYVWFDALLNYVSGLDYPGPTYEKFWPVCQHIVGKDILKPHGLFWPTMLMAADLPLYQHLNVHGYWVTPTGKMSKSLGNVIHPQEVRDQFGMDVFRYFCFREMVFGLDGVASWEGLNTRYTSDLANNLGNLVSRSLAMAEKYFNGIVPASAALDEHADELKRNADTCADEVFDFVKGMELHRALERIWSLISAANIFVDRTKPWALAKAAASDPSAKAALETSIFCQLETIRIVAVLISAFLPDTSAKILSALGESDLRDAQLLSKAKWSGALSGRKVKQIDVLFPRKDLEPKDLEPGAEKQPDSSAKEPKKSAAAKPAAASDTPGIIGYEDFAKVKLRVGQILAAEKIEKSEKLLKLSVDLGEAKERQILAGIAKFYTPDQLIGRKVAVVANLKPAKLMGMLSEGMLLASTDGDGASTLILVDPSSKIGGEIS